ncbi:MAG: DUF3021 domain-containing protein [Clostridia bacterium]|nr:DUF3021 domain-containing protein [Clostridia bacterium]
MTKNLLKLAGYGFVLGIAVWAIISVFSFNPDSGIYPLAGRFGSVKNALIVQLILSGVYGMLCMGGTVVYEIDRLPLALASLIHATMCIVPFVLLSYLFDWFKNVPDLLIMVGMQAVAYTAVWLIMFFRYKKQVKKLNEINEQIQTESGQEGKE